jgi:serine/threonine protein kinase
MSNHSIKVTYALDIWAYGISLYELIVGEHPFHDLMVNVDEDEQKGSIVELIESGITFPTTMSEAAKDLIHKCLNE